MIATEAVRGGYPDLAFWAQNGLEQVRAFVNGRGIPPPIRYLTGMRPAGVGPGTSTFTMPASGWLASAAGPILGGVLTTLADGPLGTSIQTDLPPATPYTTAELSMSYLRPAMPDGGLLTAVGTLVHRSRSLALSEARITDETGRLLAHATSRCFVFPSADVPADVPTPAPYVEPAYDTPHPFERDVVGEAVPPEVWASRSGLEILHGWLHGDLPAPPLAHLTGLRPVSAGEGWAEAAMPASGWLSSPAGTVQGGTLVMLADTAIVFAVQTTVPAGTAFAALDITAKFLRPVPPDGRDLVAKARVVHRGRTIAIGEAEVRNADDKPVLIAIGSAMLLPGRAMGVATPVTPEDETATEQP